MVMWKEYYTHFRFHKDGISVVVSTQVDLWILTITLTPIPILGEYPQETETHTADVLYLWVGWQVGWQVPVGFVYSCHTLTGTLARVIGHTRSGHLFSAFWGSNSVLEAIEMCIQKVYLKRDHL